MRLQLLMAEALRSLRASLSTTVAATMTVLIGMFLLGLAIALGTWVISWSDNVKRELVVKIFYCTDHTCKKERTTDDINKTFAFLDRHPLVKRVEFVSKEEALARMEKKSPELVQNLTFNPLPDAQEVIPRRAEDVQQIATAVQRASAAGQLKGIEKVDYGKKTASRILRVGKIVSVIFFTMVVLLLAASALLIANTIRLSIYARRREIEVMKLVGASNWFVRGPFMLEGVFCGLVGALLAVVLLLVGKELALPSILPRLDAGSDVQAWPFALIGLILLGLGLLLGAAGSGVTMRRFLRV